jgi:hypothetical protein
MRVSVLVRACRLAVSKHPLHVSLSSIGSEFRIHAAKIRA